MTSLVHMIVDLPPAAAILVKATALLAIGCLLSVALSRRNPRWRVLTWRLVMTGLILLAPAEWLLPKLRLTVEPPPTPTSTVSPASIESATPVTPPAENIQIETAPSIQPPAPPSIVAIISAHQVETAGALWLLVMVLIAARSVYVLGRVRRLVRSASPAPDAIRQMGDSIAGALGCRAPDLRLTRDLLSPFVAGIVRPVVIVPTLLTEGDRRDDLPAILAHELAHIRSRDLVWMAAARWISILLWFHPLAWWMRRAHNAACEEVCDGVAAEQTGGAPAYSRALASTFLELVVDAPQPVGVPLIRPSEIMRRIQNLRQGVRVHELSRTSIITLFVCSAMMLAAVANFSLVQAQPAKSEQTTGNLKSNDSVTSNSVEVILQLDGNTVRGAPKIAPVEKPFDVLYEKARAHYELRRIADGRWAVNLPEGQQFVVGWLAGKRMFGYISDPFEARAGRVVSFSPGMPATFEYDLTNPPDAIPCFPARVYLSKKIGGTYLNWGGVRDLKKPGVVRIDKIAGGEWLIDVQKRDRKLAETRLPFLWDKRAVTIRPGEVNRFEVIGPFIDRTVEPGDVTIRGRLIDKDDAGMGGQEIRLIPFADRELDPNRPGVSFSYFYPAQTTSPDGSFEFKGVNPKYIYQVEHWIGARQVSCLSLDHASIRKNRMITIQMQSGESSAEVVNPTAAASSTNPDGALPGFGQKHILHFPTSHAVGQVMVRDRSTAGGLQENWKLLTNAYGDINVPAGKDVALFMTEDQGSDLSFFDQFAPDGLKMLALESRLVADSDLKHIRHLTGLKALSLQGATIDGSGFQYLKDLKNLEELRLGNHGAPLKDESMANIAALPSLRWLALWGTGITDAGVERLRPLTHMQTLMLGNTKITDKSLEVTKGFTQLESLQLENTLITDDGLANLAGLTRLKHIKLGRNNITDEGMKHLEGLTNLENIWIDEDPITDRGLASLAGMRNLKELYADGTRITDAGLAALKPMKSFEHLLIGGIGDAGLAQLCGLPSLNMLQIQNSRITRAGIPSLKKMRSLKKLLISGDNVDSIFIADLKAALPACTVSDPNINPSEPQKDLSWKGRFDAIYRLEDGQNIKRIGRPFIPERLDYYKTNDPTQAEAIPAGPDMMMFKWNGSLQNRSSSFGSSFKLRAAIHFAIGLNECEFMGPNDILDIPERSDWIVREGASTDQLLKEFEAIVAKDLGRNIHFEKKTVERDVIVVRGKYKLQLEPGATKNDGVFLYVDSLTKNDGWGGGGGGFDSFLKELESDLNTRVIDESDTIKTIEVKYTLCRDSAQMNNDPAKLDRLLKNLSRQTSLEFRKERRPVEVWFVSERAALADPDDPTASRAERMARSRSAIEEAVRRR